MDFLIGKKRLMSGGFIGAYNLQKESNKKRTGFYSKKPLKEGDKLFTKDKEVGMITSSTISFTLDEFIAMGYIDQNINEPIYTKKNEKKNFIKQAKLPFLPHNLKN